MTTNDETIFIQLLNEGTIVYRPTKGKRIDDSIFLVLPTDNYDPLDEEWEFPPGKKVRCRRKIINGQSSLVAYEEVKID